MISWVKARIKSRLRRLIMSIIEGDPDQIEKLVTIVEQLRAWRASSERERQGYYEENRNPVALRAKFTAASVPVEDASINIADFEKWRKDFRKLDHFYRGFAGHVEKCLEHYLVYKWLGLSRQDVYIDVGAAKSIWVDLLNKRGISSFRLDLAYPDGFHGSNIGADAGDTKLPAGFASAMSLQCAFETFRNDSDVRFVHEAKRVLNENGRFAIVPLYSDDTYFIMSSPYADLTGIEIDPDAIRVWREDANREAFSRHYSPEAFAQRIYSQLDGMKGKILYFRNLEEVQARYPGESIYCHFMFYCKK